MNWIKINGVNDIWGDERVEREFWVNPAQITAVDHHKKRVRLACGTIMVLDESSFAGIHDWIIHTITIEALSNPTPTPVKLQPPSTSQTLECIMQQAAEAVRKVADEVIPEDQTIPIITEADKQNAQARVLEILVTFRDCLRPFFVRYAKEAAYETLEEKTSRQFKEARYRAFERHAHSDLPTTAEEAGNR